MQLKEGKSVPRNAFARYLKNNREEAWWLRHCCAKVSTAHLFVWKTSRKWATHFRLLPRSCLAFLENGLENKLTLPEKMLMKNGRRARIVTQQSDRIQGSINDILDKVLEVTHEDLIEKISFTKFSYCWCFLIRWHPIPKFGIKRVPGCRENLTQTAVSREYRGQNTRYHLMVTCQLFVIF